MSKKLATFQFIAEKLQKDLRSQDIGFKKRQDERTYRWIDEIMMENGGHLLRLRMDFFSQAFQQQILVYDSKGADLLLKTYIWRFGRLLNSGDISD